MEKKIGEKFEFRGVMLEVVPRDDYACAGCYGNDDGRICDELPPCGNAAHGTGRAFREIPKSFADAYDALIEQAERVAKLEQTPEQQAVSNATVDRLIAMRNRLSGLDVTTRVEDYGEYSGHDAPTMVSEE